VTEAAGPADERPAPSGISPRYRAKEGQTDDLSMNALRTPSADPRPLNRENASVLLSCVRNANAA